MDLLPIIEVGHIKNIEVNLLQILENLHLLIIEDLLLLNIEECHLQIIGDLLLNMEEVWIQEDCHHKNLEGNHLKVNIEEWVDILKEDLLQMNFIEENILLSNQEEGLGWGILNQDDLYRLKHKEGIMDTISLVHHNKELSKLEYYINIYYTFLKHV